MGTQVLIVDDAEWLAVTLEVALFTLPDVTVVRAASGQEAWSLVEKQPISAIITDLRMPGMDGFELVERVRAKPTGARFRSLLSAPTAPRKTRTGPSGSAPTLSLSNPTRPPLCGKHWRSFSMILSRITLCSLALALTAALPAQSQPDLKHFVERLDPRQ